MKKDTFMNKNNMKAFIQAVADLRNSATDEQALAAQILYPVWEEGKLYKTNERVLYDNILYKVLQDHTSQSDWIPDTAVSLYAKVLIADPSVISEWEQPGSTNLYMNGDRVTHNGKTWESTIDNNVWEPGVYGWKEVV